MHTNDIIKVRCTKHILMCETSGALELKLTILDFKKRKKKIKKVLTTITIHDIISKLPVEHSTNKKQS